MPMRNPPHPGEVLKEDVLPELGLTVGQLAEHLGVSRPHLSRVLNGHAGISADMDLRLSEAFAQTPGLWLKMQVAYDLWQAQRLRRKPVPLLRNAA